MSLNFLDYMFGCMSKMEYETAYYHEKFVNWEEGSSLKKASKIYTALIFLFLYLPLLVLVALSFNTSKNRVNIEGFTLRWYAELFRNHALLRLFFNSLLLSFVSAILSTILGTAAAIGIFSMKKRMQNFVMSITNIPITNPEIVTGVSLALLFVLFGTLIGKNDILGFATLLIAHITFNVPYVLLSVMPKLKQMDMHLVDAARDLGCTGRRAFFKVTIPEIMPGIVSGMIMAFTFSLDDFVISYFVSGPKFVVLPVEIYSYTKKQMPPTIYALFTIMFVGIFLLLLTINLISIKDSKKKKAL